MGALRRRQLVLFTDDDVVVDIGASNVEARYVPTPALAVQSLPINDIPIQAGPADLLGRTSPP